MENNISLMKYKEAGLYLIEKPVKQDDRKAYRSICVLSSTNKLFGHILCGRIRKAFEVEQARPSERQFGFRKDKSTIDALGEVKKFSKEVNSGDLKTRDFGLMISLDV
ncbi:hypothetical protein ILUMI_14922 [Ignelater luminosus]|uniref:Reverse transcriptase domain-containing protein n=1 Tax=Ignelater luminosus TaxID=2038154 RepID=A0A8K0CU22_IGNLU|nr:hypothetical protein ILUMI_14922 [Ignelater luminosus]